ncbi:3-deoxy-7-phosphoheptulonate synthase AroG [soil metagenome]
MSSPTDDVRIDEIHPLVAPVTLMAEMPAGEAETDSVFRSRREIEAIFSGRDDRLLVVVGPCSIHDSDVALDYARHLQPAIGRFGSELKIVMRVYFEKPRTTVGWKGFINDPHLDDSFDINRGLHLARWLLLELNRMGVPAGTEFLDTISPQYIADLVSWAAIGARTTESQVHRELASGLSMPVGFKNGTGGSIAIAVDAIRAARCPHNFLSVTKKGQSAIVRTRGNESCHIILRGGRTGPNYEAAQVDAVVAQLKEAGLPPYVMVDCSHGNSLKDFRNQPKVAADLAAQVAGGSRAVAGVMIESHLVEGSQNVVPGKGLLYGQSITDACVSWDTTEQMLEELASAVRGRR